LYFILSYPRSAETVDPHNGSLNLDRRSIKEVEVEFEPRCRVLVGINESGKSNVRLDRRVGADERRSSQNVEIEDAVLGSRLDIVAVGSECGSVATKV
jgi:hypothetical protein